MIARKPLGLVLAGLGTVGAWASVTTAVGAAPSGAGSPPGLGRSVDNAEPEPSAAGQAAAVRWLDRAARAQRTRSYSGTQYICAWRGSTTAGFVVELEHTPGQGTVVRVRPSAGTGQNAIFEAEPVAATRAVDPLAMPSGDGATDPLLDNYDLSVSAGPGSAVEVVARRADQSVAGRFWIDRGSGLLVRREVFDASGGLVRAGAYVNLDVGRVRARAAGGSETQPVVSGRLLDRTQRAQLRAAGWVLPESLPGDMDLYDARQTRLGTDDVVHASYSDGLSTLSLFVQPGRLDDAATTGWQTEDIGGQVFERANGLDERMLWEGRGWVFTVVSDAPVAVLDAVIAGLPHGEKHRGIWARLGHGLSRVGSWLDPFG